MGSIPVVWNHTGLWPLFSRNKMVVLQKDVENDITPEGLERQVRGESARHMLLAQFWFDQIDNAKAKYLRDLKENIMDKRWSDKSVT